MYVGILIALMVGIIAVFQGTINRLVSEDLGLSKAVHLNNIVVFIIGILFFYVVRFFPQWFPAFIRPKDGWGHLSWWYIIPGLCGFAIVAGVPYAISKLGALRVFIVIVAAQVITSIIWDYYKEGIPVTSTRLIASVLAILSVIIVRF